MNAHGRPSLRRRVDERLIAGVVGGIADWLNAPVVFLRVVVYLALTFWPWSMAGYAAAALLVPARGHDRPGWDNLVALARVGALSAGPVILWGSDLSADELFRRSPDLWVPLSAFYLVAVAVFLTRSYPHGPSDEEARATVLGAAPTFLAVAALALGIWLAPGVRWEHGVALVPLVAGVYLLVGARAGSWRARVGPAAVAAFAAAAVAGAGVRLDGGIGDRAWVASAQASPPAAQSVAVGNLKLDLVKLPRTDRTVDVRASVGVGELDVYIPQNARVSLDLKVGRGSLDLSAGRVSSGLDLEVHRRHGLVGGTRVPGKNFRGTRIHLDLSVGSGTLSVYRGHP
jgi:phage shock protein PspC (stress-responsive transcriptional regulator)